MGNSIVELLDDMQVGDDDTTSLGKVIERFEDRGFGPLLLIPALIALLPTGAIPGVPTLCGITLFFICTQVAMGKSSPWLPKFIKDKEVSSEKLDSAVEKAKPFAQKTEKIIKPRLSYLSRSPSKNIIAAYCAVAAICMIPLEVLPFAVAMPAFALCVTALGITNRDGAFLIVGTLLQLGTGYLVYKALAMM
ncbi:MAG: exopolysaccharide biosynthesis protein [Pseudomonadota bacterium]|nr:exopolysaccharide biosynthesis protein [Pseudomonadota bacterium]